MKTCNMFNPTMFTLARSYRNKTQAELCKAAQISQGLLSKLEHGIKSPSKEQIAAIADALGFPESFFLQQGVDYPTGMIYHRKRAALQKKRRQQIEAEAKLKLLCLKPLISDVEIENNIKKFDLDDFSNNPAKVAAALRGYWKVPNGPIKNLINLLENNGIIIMRFNFGNSQIDGFFIQDDLPCIVVNSRFPMDRQRFTIAHELGHMVMHDVAYDDIESEANLFASEFLMPSADIEDYFHDKRISLRLLAALKPVWRVSMAALLMRAKNLKYISSSNYRRLIIEMNKLGYRKNEPIQIAQEKESLIEEIIEVFKSTFNYSNEELMKIMHLSPNEFDTFFGASNNYLKLV